jgi:molybdenum cofactor guanylyltransferase
MRWRGCARRWINANRNQERYGLYGHRVVGDTLADYQGPLAGILTAMTAVDRPWLVATPCDSPLLPIDLVRRLFAAVRAEQADIAVAHDGERMQPVVALLRCSLRDSLRDFLEQGGRKIDAWYAQHALAIADLSDCAAAFANVNTPEERAALEAQVPDLSLS